MPNNPCCPFPASFSGRSHRTPAAIPPFVFSLLSHYVKWSSRGHGAGPLCCKLICEAEPGEDVSVGLPLKLIGSYGRLGRALCSADGISRKQRKLHSTVILTDEDYTHCAIGSALSHDLDRKFRSEDVPLNFRKVARHIVRNLDHSTSEWPEAVLQQTASPPRPPNNHRTDSTAVLPPRSAPLCVGLPPREEGFSSGSGWRISPDCAHLRGKATQRKLH
ncbi:unnamed protein product [Boreogadus saida]